MHLRTLLETPLTRFFLLQIISVLAVALTGPQALRYQYLTKGVPQTNCFSKVDQDFSDVSSFASCPVAFAKSPPGVYQPPHYFLTYESLHH